MGEGSAQGSVRSDGLPEAEAQDLDPLDELAEISADLAALLAFESLTGGFALPRPAANALETTFGPPVDLSRAPAPMAPAATTAAPRPMPRPEPARPEPGRPEPARAPSPVFEAPRAISAPPSGEAPRQGQLCLPSRWAALATPSSAASAADPAQGLEAVRAEIGDCRRCGLCEGRKNIVFGVGNPAAQLAVVGEAPGAREDELGEPFVGEAGAMLDRMLENVLGLKRPDVYILNVVKCRPPGNRNPELSEIASCKRFMEAQLDVIKPQLILSVGNIATKTLLNTTRGITGLRGQWHSWQGRIPVMATFHPAYLLRTPGDKRLTLEDLKLVKQRLVELGPKV